MPPSVFDDYDVIKHATSVGMVTIAWNSLHEMYGHVFTILVSRKSPKLGWAIWGAIKNDRAARDVLAATAKAVKGENSKFFKEIQWAINNTPTLEDNRDTAVHAPMAFEVTDEESIRLAPSTLGEHQRAKKLEGKDVEAELSNYRENIEKLAKFVIDVGYLIDESDDSPSWPERPRLRRVAHPQTHKQSRLRNKTK